MDRNGLSAGEWLVVAAGTALGLVGGVVWLGATGAARLHGTVLHVSLADAVRAASRLPSHASDPAAAWPAPAAGALPGPGPYWAVTVAVAVVALVAVAVVVRVVLRSKVGTVPRRPLGVDARARFATDADLRHLVVGRHHPGRFLLGRHGKHLLATEAPARPGRRRRRRLSDTGAVALIGPSRSGKTTAAVSGILSWPGPAVLSSVKADLLGATAGWRARLGSVAVYDPTGTTKVPTASWSPLRSAGTVLGAQRAARALCEAAPSSEGVKGGLDFWLAEAEILLSGLLFVAAKSGRDMAEVCRWVMTQDRPREADYGDVQLALDLLLGSGDTALAEGAEKAARAIGSIWAMEDETRSSVYATAQTVVWPWADPGVAAASSGAGLHLGWLLGGPNTVYLCAPIEDQARLAPAFGGLLNDLVRQVFLKVAADGKPLDPPLLVVVDEAGNTPLRSLPEYASTLAGLGVVLVTVWQSVAQIEHAYGRQADSILTNHRSKLFYTGLADPSALRWLAAVLGEVEVETRSRTDAAEGQRSEQLATSREPLVPPHVARQMRPGDALLVHGTLPPAHVAAVPWFSDRRLRWRSRRRFDPKSQATATFEEVRP
ncbi:MAG TPA: type IV secretory system conjugative DNA transfer family protein [Acidimicrobiales bacterium]|nr:type IV secretory system conjugative DNA transfer family protein [Acidimicrobiales bacterium]